MCNDVKFFGSTPQIRPFVNILCLYRILLYFQIPCIRLDSVALSFAARSVHMLYHCNTSYYMDNLYVHTRHNTIPSRRVSAKLAPNKQTVLNIIHRRH